MKRLAMLVIAGSLLAPLMGPPAAADDCDPGEISLPYADPIDARVYAYCGQHPGLLDLPLCFRANVPSRPPNLSGDDVTNAIVESVNEWTRHWPFPLTTEVPPVNEFGPPLCYLGGNSNRVGVNHGDNENTISWSDDLECDGNSGHKVAVACIRYAPGRHRIVEIDIVLSAEVRWFQPRPPDAAAELLTGEITASLDPDICNNVTYAGMPGVECETYDVQSVITHELGHALGLLDLPPGRESEDCWPAITDDAWKYQETMYACGWPGTTNKRTLHVGDTVGLLRIALDVMTDG